MALDRLQAHWGFTRLPFGRDLAPSQLFPAHAHREAVARLRWLIAEQALGVLTGEVGAGKTVAARAATAGLDHRSVIVYCGNPAVGMRGYYRQIVETLGGVPPYQKCALIAETTTRLAAEQAERGRAVVLLIDEAHLLGTEALEELRFLTNDAMDAHALFACCLIGQPTLRRRLKLGAYAALDQRVALRYHLDGMDRAETADYLRHHLAVAGRSDPLFTDDALACLHTTSRGLPRAVNTLALQALTAAFADGKALVDEASARAAITEVAAE